MVYCIRYNIIFIYVDKILSTNGVNPHEKITLH